MCCFDKFVDFFVDFVGDFVGVVWLGVYGMFEEWVVVFGVVFDCV